MQSTQPANYGVQLDNHQDPQLIQQNDRPVPIVKDPILNPDLVKQNPTQRQGQILSQLSELRKVGDIVFILQYHFHPVIFICMMLPAYYGTRLAYAFYLLARCLTVTCQSTPSI